MKRGEFGPNIGPFSNYPELNHLRAGNLAVSASVVDTATPYPEFSRTKATLFAQYYIHRGDDPDWELLTQAQAPEIRLRPRTYDELHSLSRDAMPDRETYQAVELGNAIHDNFKNTDLLPDFGLSSGANHDDALMRLFLPEYSEARQRHFSSLNTMSERQLRLIRGMLSVNFIRFVQSQASEQEIIELASLPGDELRCAIMHGIHDLAGSRGDIADTTSLTLDEPAAVRLLDGAYALLATPDELGWSEDVVMTPHVRRLIYMQLRANRLGIGNETVPPGEVSAKLAVADMLRCYSAEDFAVPQAAFDRLPPLLRRGWELTQALPLQYPNAPTRLKGIGTEYAPAFLRAFGQDEDALLRGLSYFAQIQLQANLLIFELSQVLNDEWPPREAPYHKIDFYPLAKAFRKTPPDFTKPFKIIYSVHDNILIPELADPSQLETVRVKLLRPPESYPDQPQAEHS